MQRERLARALRRTGTVAVVDEILVELGLDAVPGTPLGALVDGVLVLWCRLPAARCTRLVQEAEQRGLRLVAGPRFGTGQAFEDRLRLPYTLPPDALRRAVRVLVEADAAAAAPRQRRSAGV